MRQPYYRNYRNQRSIAAMAVSPQFATNGLINNEDTVEVIVKFSGDINSIAQELNAQVEILLNAYAIITLSPDKIARLYAYPQIEDIELPKNLFIEGLYNLTSTCIRSAQSTTNYGLTGKGVIVAIIDYGIDYLHRDFQNADGSSRIIYLWDQTIEGKPPLGFSGGTEYSNFQINQAIRSSTPTSIVPSIDTSGHGTAVAGIAAGNGSENPDNIGVAPESDLIIVKIGLRGFESFARTTELMRAMKYVIEKSRMLNKPVAINISFGMNDGSHRGDSLFETYVSDMSNEWKTSIIIPTGNEGAAGHHYSTKLQSNNIKNIEFFVANGINKFYLSIWKDFVDIFSVELLYPDGTSSGIISMENQLRRIRIGNSIMNIAYKQPTRYSVRQEISLIIQSVNGSIASGLWKLRLITTTIVNGKVDIWLPTIEEVTSNTRFSEPVETMTMTIPSTARKVIKVAGYNDRIGNLAEFSGVGSAEQLEPRPDLAAPAVSILAPKNGGGYDAYTGTSIAAPFVTGSAALMMQWGIILGNDPFLYAERVKAYLRLGAIRKENQDYPNALFGYGTLCLCNSIDYLVRYKGGGNIWL